MVAPKFSKLAIDRRPHDDHSGQKSGYFVHVAAAMLPQLRLVRLPYVANAVPSVFSLVHAHTNEYLPTRQAKGRHLRDSPETQPAARMTYQRIGFELEQIRQVTTQ